MASSFIQVRWTDKTSLRLSINKKTHKVMYAQARKESVDFLFHIFSLPFGTIMKLLQEYSLPGSFGSLYESIAKLDDSYIMYKQTKDAILNPKLPNYGACIPLLFPNEAVPIPKVNSILYACGLHPYISDGREVRCPSCKLKLGNELCYMTSLEAQESIASGGGFVKDVVAYMITDDLEVKAWSTAYTLTTLSEFGLEDYDDLEEKEVSLGTKEGLMLLKASFECKQVLTTVFLAE